MVIVAVIGAVIGLLVLGLAVLTFVANSSFWTMGAWTKTAVFTIILLF